MLSFIRKRLSYANIAVTAALLFAMAGGAWAASGPARVAAHKASKGGVEITSIKQISKKVLNELKGKAGPAGLAGKEGPAGKEGLTGKEGVGKEGKEGKQGAAGPEGPPGEKGEPGTTGFTETLPEDKTEKGMWALTTPSAAGFLSGGNWTAVSYVIPLAAAPEHLNVLKPDEIKPKCEEPGLTCSSTYASGECTGNVETPGAGPGSLCIFEAEVSFENVASIIIASGSSGINSPSSPLNGAELGVFPAKQNEYMTARGSWAVTEKIGA